MTHEAGIDDTLHPMAAVTNDGWTPANEPAEVLTHLSAIAHDLERLGCIISATHARYDKKLLFKYFIGEFVSFMDNIDDLLKIINSLPIQRHGEILPRPGVLATDLARTRELAKLFHRERTAAEVELRRIRNQIGAHREQIGWTETAALWANIEKPILQRVHDAARELFAFLTQLPVYQWFRVQPDGTMNFMSPIPPGLFDD
jgi:hypothetical protein